MSNISYIQTRSEYIVVIKGVFVTDGKANRHTLESSLKKNLGIPEHFVGPIITLLSKFELAIPLDGSTFFIPSSLHSRKVKKLEFSKEHYTFPRKNIAASNAECDDINNPLRPSLNYRCLPLVVRHTCTREIVLHPSGMCYRRIFVADYIPVNFWPRVIARILSSAESFQKIICSNCFSNIHRQNFVEVGNANIGGLHCRWSYGKNHIILTLGNDVILRVNGLYSFKNVENKRERIPISCSVGKLKGMHIYHDSGFNSMNVNDGFEITIPDYVVHSGNNSSLVHESKLMSAQILSRVLETIDEVLKDWFEGLIEEGIYSDKYFTHFIPCPYCFGDVKPNDMLCASLEEELSEFPCSNNSFVKAPIGPAGFSFQYCLYQARISNYVKCSNCPFGEKLSLKYLAPDVVSFKNA